MNYTGNCSCPFFAWLEVFEKKWNLRIVRELYCNNLGFNELKTRIKSITQGVLSQRLQELEKHGLIHKAVLKQKPLTVEYSLDSKVKDMLSCWPPIKVKK